MVLTIVRYITRNINNIRVGFGCAAAGGSGMSRKPYVYMYIYIYICIYIFNRTTFSILKKFDHFCALLRLLKHVQVHPGSLSSAESLLLLSLGLLHAAPGAWQPGKTTPGLPEECHTSGVRAVQSRNQVLRINQVGRLL